MSIIESSLIIWIEIGDWLIRGVDYLIETRRLTIFVDALYRERVCPRIRSKKSTLIKKEISLYLLTKSRINNNT